MYNGDFESEFCQKAWQVINDIAEQLSYNHTSAVSLSAQAKKLQDEAAQAQTGFSLRRFNVDITKETLESELERINAQLLIENQSLSHENKQLSLLLKEYEQTVEVIMNKLRGHRTASHFYEADLIRYYEHRLSQEISPPYPASHPHTAYHLHRLTRGLHAILAVLDGKNLAELPEDLNADDADPVHSQALEPSKPAAIEPPEVIVIPSSQPQDLQETEASYPPPIYPPVPSNASSSDVSSSEVSSLSSSESHLSHAPPCANTAEHTNETEPRAEDVPAEDIPWGEARELEIDRLTAENAHFRRLLGIDDESMTAAGLPLTFDVPLTIPPSENQSSPSPVPAPTSRGLRLSAGLFVLGAWQQPPQEQPSGGGGGWTTPPGAQQQFAMPSAGSGGGQFHMQMMHQQPQFQQQTLQMQAQMQAQYQQGNNIVGRGGLFSGAGRGSGMGPGRARGSWMGVAG